MEDNLVMKKLIFLLFFCLVIICGCTNISDVKTEKENNQLFLLVHTKDEDGCDQTRLILLTRENKDTNWKVINEGL